MPNKDDFIFNELVGGKGGDNFGDALWSDKPVTEVEAWYGHAWGADFTVLKGLRVHWGDRSSPMVGHPSGDALHTSYSFAPNERVRWMTLNGADPGSEGRCDAIRFEANNPFAAGGTGGFERHENPGNHVSMALLEGRQEISIAWGLFSTDNQDAGPRLLHILHDYYKGQSAKIHFLS